MTPFYLYSSTFLDCKHITYSPTIFILKSIKNIFLSSLTKTFNILVDLYKLKIGNYFLLLLSRRPPKGAMVSKKKKRQKKCWKHDRVK